MTQSFKNMLYLLGAGARGFEIDASGMDMQKIRECAIYQGVWPLVYKAAEKTADVRLWRAEFLLNIGRWVSRKEFCLKTIKELEAAGYKYCLMKGNAIAKYYALPECRISSDTDIYIEPSKENEVMEFLEARGYVAEPREKGDHHFRASHPVGGILEVHIRFYSKTTEKIVFEGEIDYSQDYEKTAIDGDEYYVMNPDDELMYLTAHYIKHLVNDGCGIRQMLDLLIYMEKNGDKIDFDKYNALMKKLRYDKLIDVIKTVGAVYFGYDYPAKYPDLAEKLLTDAENGGAFGFKADDRANFHRIYCEQRRKRSEIGGWFRLKMLFIKKLFPSRVGMMSRGYNYANHTILLPFAWAHRFFNLAVKQTKETEYNKTAMEKSYKRIGMMKELGMVE